MRKHYTPAFKAQIVQEVLKENKTISSIASEHASSQSDQRKALAVLSGMASLLTTEHQTATEACEEHEQACPTTLRRNRSAANAT